MAKGSVTVPFFYQYKMYPGLTRLYLEYLSGFYQTVERMKTRRNICSFH